MRKTRENADVGRIEGNSTDKINGQKSKSQGFAGKQQFYVGHVGEDEYHAEDRTGRPSGFLEMSNIYLLIPREGHPKSRSSISGAEFRDLPFLPQPGIPATMDSVQTKQRHADPFLLLPHLRDDSGVCEPSRTGRRNDGSDKWTRVSPPPFRGRHGVRQALGG